MLKGDFPDLNLAIDGAFALVVGNRRSSEALLPQSILKPLIPPPWNSFRWKNSKPTPSGSGVEMPAEFA
jgi:hypothetical protein